MANGQKDFLTVAENIDNMTTAPKKRGRPTVNVANVKNGKHLTVYLTDELFDYLDSMSRITRKSKARYMTDLLTTDKEENAGLYMSVLELQKKV